MYDAHSGSRYKYAERVKIKVFANQNPRNRKDFYAGKFIIREQCN